MTVDVLPGAEVFLDRDASVQFALNPIRFRVAKVLPHKPPWGWVWLSGYQLDASGEAVAQREVMVRLDGLRVVERRRCSRMLQGVAR